MTACSKPKKKPKAKRRSQVETAPGGENLRTNQLFAIKAINKVFGPFKKCKPQFWAERTYLTIVAKIYEHLVLHADISPKEMMELAKAFTENCKLDRASFGERFSTPEGRKLLDGFEAAIQQLYGTAPPAAESASSQNGVNEAAMQSSRRLGRAQTQLPVDQQQERHDDQTPV